MMMDEPDSVEQFHEGGATSSGMRAVHDLSARCLDALLPAGGRLLELGCGSGRALAYLAARRPDITATAVDLAPNMLNQARELMTAECVSERIRLIKADIADLPEDVSAEPWNAVSCVWTLHHLPDTETLVAVLRQISSLREKSGCAIWILDLQRLKNAGSFPLGLRALEPALSERLREDAIASEAAAFTFQELGAGAEQAGLVGLQGGYSRPIRWQQAHWQPARGQSRSPSPSWHEARLEQPARLDAVLLRYGFRNLPI